MMSATAVLLWLSVFLWQSLTTESTYNHILMRGNWQGFKQINANQSDVHNLSCSSGCGEDIKWIVNGQIVDEFTEVKGEYSVMSIKHICSISMDAFGCNDCMTLDESVRYNSSLQIMSNATLKIECMVVQKYHTKKFHVVRKGYNITVQQNDISTSDIMSSTPSTITELKPSPSRSLRATPTSTSSAIISKRSSSIVEIIRTTTVTVTSSTQCSCTNMPAIGCVGQADTVVMSSVIPVGIVIIMVVIVIVLVVGILVVKKTLPRRKQSTGSADSESEVGTKSKSQEGFTNPQCCQ